MNFCSVINLLLDPDDGLMSLSLKTKKKTLIFESYVYLTCKHFARIRLCFGFFSLVLPGTE